MASVMLEKRILLLNRTRLMKIGSNLYAIDEENVMSREQNASIEPLLPTENMQVMGDETKQTVLIVEDDIEIGRLLVLLISQETPYQVRLVQSGREALRIVHDIHPVLFILDYYLPSMTGLQLFDLLHAKEEWATIPAIMISANLPVKELEKRGIIGLSKPFDLDKLLEIIERMTA